MATNSTNVLKLKIGLIAPAHYRTEFSAASLSFSRLAKALRSLGTDVIELYALTIFEAEQKVRAAKFEQGIDLVHAFEIGPVAHGAIMAARSLGLPNVLGPRWEVGSETSFDNQIERFALLPWQLRQAGKLISTSPAVHRRASEIAEFYTLPGAIIMPSIDADEFMSSVTYKPSQEEKDRTALGLMPFGLPIDPKPKKPSMIKGSPLIGAVAFDWSKSEKGLFDFVEACHRLIVNQYPQARLLIVGKAGEKAARLNNYVTATGLIPHSQVAFYMRMCNVGVIPSARETPSDVLLEWMVAGVPVAATNTGMNREIIKDLGQVVPVGNPSALADAINNLWTMLEVDRKRLVNEARGRALTAFTPEIEALHYVRVYHEMITNANPTPDESERE